MCGIAGSIGLDPRVANAVVARMLDIMPYRGPDDRGIWSDGNVTLGHLRLSIIDLSPAGHQPMLSHDKRFALTFNGEIFNYIELREQLQSLGATFTTTGDSEVILEAYRYWGPDCVSRFNGMWAFAVYDRDTQTTFLSRDRFGVKPLFYTNNGGEIHFASEMKALLSVTGKVTPNWQYFYHFFDRCTPLGSDQTVFDGILHLRPSHSMIVCNGNVDIRRYWQPSPQRPLQHDNPVRAFRDLLTDAVRLRLRSDVPVGVCLSGGVDSSVIATLIASMGVTPETFSVIYKEPECSEELFVDAVNAATGAHPHTLTPGPHDLFPVLERLVVHHDEPVRMPGCFSHWHVMQCASDHVTVLLDGQGADEILGGYREFYPHYLASLLLDMALLRRPADAWGAYQECIKGLQTHMGSSTPSVREAYASLLPHALRSALGRKRAKQQLFHPDFLSRYAGTAIDDATELSLLKKFPSRLDAAMYRMFAETNLPMLLRYEDRNSMAFSLEARVPFLDYRVVEFCHSLDYRMKMKGYTTKWLLREAFADLLPKQVSARTDKKGFPTPTSRWFRNELKDEVRRRLSDGPLYDLGIMHHAEVMRILEQHESGKADRERDIFRLLTLDVWLRTYLW